MKGKNNPIVSRVTMKPSISNKWPIGKITELKNRIHQPGVDVCNQADIEGKPIQGYNEVHLMASVDKGT